MNNEQQLLKNTKKLYDAIINLLSNPNVHLAMLQAYPDIDSSPDKFFLLDSLKFMSYISNSDGIISQKEINIINYITSFYLTTTQLNELISKNDFYSDINEVPLTVKIICNIENALYRNNAAVEEESLMNILIMYFESIGKLVANTDNGISSIENSRIEAYIENIKRYAIENTLSPFFDY